MIVVGIFENAILRARDAADKAGKKTGEMVEFSKLKISAAENQKKIDGEYAELGKMVYKAAKDHTDCTEYVNEKAVAIDALFEKQKELEDKINAMRKIKKCEQCGSENTESAEYCCKCGAKL